MNNHRFFHISLLLAICLLLGFFTTTAAQTDPEETAVPYPVETVPATVNSGYPDNVQPLPPTLTPANPTPYPATTDIPPTTSISIPIIGDGNSTPGLSPVATAVPAPLPSSSQLIQSRMVLWLGFLIGSFILGTGIYGAIILYTRK